MNLHLYFFASSISTWAGFCPPADCSHSWAFLDPGIRSLPSHKFPAVLNHPFLVRDCPLSQPRPENPPSQYPQEYLEPLPCRWELDFLPSLLHQASCPEHSNPRLRSIRLVLWHHLGVPLASRSMYHRLQRWGLSCWGLKMLCPSFSFSRSRRYQHRHRADKVWHFQQRCLLQRLTRAYVDLESLGRGGGY